MPPTKRQAPVVSMINMKGGVGKTTLSGNLSFEVFRNHQVKILLIDFDPQINLTQLLLTRRAYENIRSISKTLWGVMEPEAPDDVFTVSTADNLDVGPVSDYTHKLTYLLGKPEVTLDLLPGDFRLALLNLRESPSSLKIARKRFDDLLTKARTEYDLIILDCNPSSSFLTRCAIESSTHLLIPVRPDKYSILGLEMLVEYTDGLPGLSRKPEIIVILNGVKKGPNSVVSEIRGHSSYGPKVLVTAIPETGILHARADYVGFAANRKVAYSATIASILARAANELAKKLHLIK